MVVYLEDMALDQVMEVRRGRLEVDLELSCF